MAPKKYTTRSSGSCEIHEAAATQSSLDLPEGESFRPLPPRATLVQMIERSRQLRQWFPHGLRSPAERWQAKTNAEFRL